MSGGRSPVYGMLVVIEFCWEKKEEGNVDVELMCAINVN